MHVQTNNLTNKFFGKLIIFSSFPDFEQNFQKFDKKFLAGLSQLNSCVSRWRFFFNFWRKEMREIFFPKKLHCYHFQTLNTEDPQCSCKHCYCRLVKNSMYMFRRTFLQIGFLESLSFFRLFPEFQVKVFRVLMRMFWQDGHNYVLHVQMYRSTISGKIFFFRKIDKISRRFLESERQIWGYFGKIFLVWLSRLHSPLLKKLF